MKKVMMVYCVLWNATLVAVMTCATDAAEVAKGLHGSTVTTCHLNDYSDTGKLLIQNPA
jgi:hypothetical protein